jgi:hypothetical protein
MMGVFLHAVFLGACLALHAGKWARFVPSRPYALYMACNYIPAIQIIDILLVSDGQFCTLLLPGTTRQTKPRRVLFTSNIELSAQKSMCISES